MPQGGAPLRIPQALLLLLQWILSIQQQQVQGLSLPTPPPHSSQQHTAANNIKIPEDLVQCQLNAFAKCNIADAYQYNSPTNQDMVGPWESFAAALSEPAFRPLLGHDESCVIMTVSHDDGDFVCCLAKIVPGKGPLPKRLQEVIEQNLKDEGFSNDIDDDDNDSDDEDTDDTDDDEDEDEDEEEEDELTIRTQRPPYLLYWWEVSKQFHDENDPQSFYYQVDSVLPDAEDLELDYMETTMFANRNNHDDDDEEYYDDDDDDDDDGFFFDLGIY